MTAESQSIWYFVELENLRGLILLNECNFSLLSILYRANRALKTKHDTPKYGLIYHASLVGQTTSKNKGKVSSSLTMVCCNISMILLVVRIILLFSDFMTADLLYFCFLLLRFLECWQPKQHLQYDMMH